METLAFRAEISDRIMYNGFGLIKKVCVDESYVTGAQAL